MSKYPPPKEIQTNTVLKNEEVEAEIHEPHHVGQAEEMERQMDEYVPYTHVDVLSALRRMQKRGCKPTHIELSSKHLDEIERSFPKNADWLTAEKYMRLYGMEIVKNEDAACPAVQWRQRDEGPHQQELVAQD